ncbi:hypothetical protein BV22DRAFT_480129 [Leucogyrophana mollusca]|uniref:Uncharacterized protein n=1 Tax=Leucogyrophana mollusca TaxID=85980 RepID=A0ACB8BJT7_9AGAM|nr:hypothetical protein BV22DRAFT_480129 [Leucogyrophana mollusca]
MIHLDRNHNELSPTQNSNIILNESHTDPNNDILQWDPIPHDTAKFQDSTDKYFQDVSDSFPDPPLTDDSHTAHNTDPVSRLSAPSSPRDPQDDKSSSLSPAPGSPQLDRKSPPPSPQRNVVDADKPDGEGTFSRQLTPLTDLSPAPDYDDGTDADNKDADESNESSGGTAEQRGQGDLASKDKQPHINGTKSPSRTGGTSPSRQPSTLAAPQNHSSELTTSRSDEKPTSAAPSHTSRPPSREPSASSNHPFVPNSSMENHRSGVGDSKVVRILELNAELLKVCMEFQIRAMPITEPRFQYATRLQANLTWLAAAADQRHGNSPMALPIMDPPIALDFTPTDRIQELYADLPTLFAKDVARRQLMGAQHNGSPPAPSALPNGHLKRNRPDDMSDPMSKRRDMGDTKSQSMQPPAVPSISISGTASRSSPPNSFAPPNNTINLSVPGGSVATPQSPRIPSPTSMGPPSLTTSLPFGVTEAQIAANSRNRAREIQIQQAREQQQRQQAQIQQMQAARRMSPPSTSPQAQQMPGQNMPPNAAAGPSNMQNMNQAMINQQLQILRNPAHPLMQYMASHVPNFSSLTPQQQLQAFQTLAARQQAEQQRNAAQMPGMPQAGMPPMSNGAMPGMNLAGGSQNPASPHSQPSPDLSQQMHSQSPQNPMFSFNQGQNNPGMDPRIAASNFTPQMQAQAQAQANADLTRQRQMLLMQQMRGANGNVNAPGMMTPQQVAFMQQRMAQGASSQHGGSPMSAPGNDSFPALRSNSTIPGIARSGRSPSDGVHSPMTPRTPSRLSQQPQQQMQPDDYQRAMMQHAQATMMGGGGGNQQQQPMGYNPQLQPNPNWQQNGQHAGQMGHGQVNGFGMGPSGNAGAANAFGVAPSPSNQGWPQQQQQQAGAHGYPYGSSMGQRHPSEQARTPRNMSGTPVPQNISPTGDNPSNGDYDLLNWNGQ